MTSFTGLFSSVHVKEQEVIEKRKQNIKIKKVKKLKGELKGENMATEMYFQRFEKRLQNTTDSGVNRDSTFAFLLN